MPSIDKHQLIQKTTVGFSKLAVGEHHKTNALGFIQEWITNPRYADYRPQIEHMIDHEYWEYLFDSFYQVIPFGTGGRRGEVGIGPNRINPITIEASAQGHSQYLIKQFGETTFTRGVVIAYDVREFFTNKYFDNNLPNPVQNLKGLDLAQSATQVYTANKIKTYIFPNVRTTPELSFAIRHLNAVGGAMLSASHNPPEHNGKKVFDQFGGQLIPPEDEILVAEVTQNVSAIKRLELTDARNQNLLVDVDVSVDQSYINAVANLSLSDQRDIKIAYTPLHGCGGTSVVKVLEQVGFIVDQDPKTSNPSGRFENVTFNIPNPEVEQSFDTTILFADQINADIILNSDPDADRIGIMAKHNGKWTFFNGNEIGVILADYAIKKKKAGNHNNGVIIKTAVTTNLISKIATENNFKVIGNLLVGFKYIGEEMNRMEEEGSINSFVFAAEESHGYIAGHYIREKDAALAGLWLAEIAAELKSQQKTLVDQLTEIYTTYGYYRNYLTEIRLPGAEGMDLIQKIQRDLRSNPPKKFGNYHVTSSEDWLNRKPILSGTDQTGKDGVVFDLKPNQTGIDSIKVTVRPSGTEPKIKMYFEIATSPNQSSSIEEIKSTTEQELHDVEKAFMDHCYHRIGIDFPSRGYLLFWQLPLQQKMKYFEIEPRIVELTQTPNQTARHNQLRDLVSFLGSDPLTKVNPAFKAKYHQTVEEYLSLKPF